MSGVTLLEPESHEPDEARECPRFSPFVQFQATEMSMLLLARLGTALCVSRQVFNIQEHCPGPEQPRETST